MVNKFWLCEATETGSETEVDNNDGNFRSLIRLLANNCDADLKHHIEIALYISPHIQNQISKRL